MRIPGREATAVVRESLCGAAHSPAGVPVPREFCPAHIKHRYCSSTAGGGGYGVYPLRMDLGPLLKPWRLLPSDRAALLHRHMQGHAGFGWVLSPWEPGAPAQNSCSEQGHPGVRSHHKACMSSGEALPQQDPSLCALVKVKTSLACSPTAAGLVEKRTGQLAAGRC